METIPLNRRYTITEAAEMLGVTAKTLWRWEKAGKIKKAVRDWRGWRVYTRDQVDQMMGKIMRTES